MRSVDGHCIKSKLNYWIITLLLLTLVSFCGLAYGADLPIKDSFGSYVSENDLSFRILRAVFGRVEGVAALNFGQSTVFSVVFKALSYGALFIESILLSYMVIKIVTETNIDSNGMSRGTMIWTPIRCALSTSLLIPSSTTGYSMIHSLVMLIVIQGVGLANMLWGNVTQFLLKENNNLYSGVVVANGGASIAETVASKLSVPDPSLIDYAFPSTVEYVDKTEARSAANYGTADLMRSMLCTHVVAARLDGIRQHNLSVLNDYKESIAKAKNQETVSKSVTVESDTLSSCIRNLENSAYVEAGIVGDGNSVYTDSNGVVAFPGLFNLDSYKCVNKLRDGVDGLEDFPDAATLIGICGSVNYGVEGTSDSGRVATIKHTVLMRMISDMTGVAQRLIDYRFDPNGKYKENAQKFVEDNYGHLSAQSQPCYSSDQKTGSCSTVVNNVPLNGTGNTGVFELPNSLQSNAYAYQTSVYNSIASRLVNSANPGETKLKLYDTLNSQGWMLLGNYYLELAKQVNSVVASQVKTVRDVFLRVNGNSDSARSQIFPELTITEQQQRALQNFLGDKSKYYKALVDVVLLTNASAPVAKKMMESYVAVPSGSVGSGVSSSTVSDAINSGSGFSEIDVEKQRRLLGTAVGMDPTRISVVAAFGGLPIQICAHHMFGLTNEWTKQMMGSGDPIYRIIAIGEKMVGAVSGMLADFYKTIITYMAASAAWPIVGLVGVTAASPGTFWGTTSGLVTLFQTLTDMTIAGAHMGLQFYTIYLPLVMGIAVPLFACGILLSIYVPLIPTLLFIFGGISWIISVIVLLVAAPIICFLMLWGGASQENPLLSREAEQFIQQLVGAFFRPALMVVGFLSGMVLSYVGFELLNLAIGQTYIHFFSDSTSYSRWDVIGNMKNIGAMVKGLGFMGVYTYAAVSIVNMSFSMIHLLYSEAMRAVGVSAPAVGLEERNVEAAKAGATQFGEAGGGAARGIGEGASQRAGVLGDTVKTTAGGVAASRKGSDPRKNKGGSVESANDGQAQQ